MPFVCCRLTTKKDAPSPLAGQKGQMCHPFRVLLAVFCPLCTRSFARRLLKISIGKGRCQWHAIQPRRQTGRLTEGVSCNPSPAFVASLRAGSALGVVHLPSREQESLKSLKLLACSLGGARRSLGGSRCFRWRGDVVFAPRLSL